MANKTFATMKTNVGTMVQDTSASMKTNIGVYLNNRLSEVRRRLNLYGLNRLDYTFSTVAGTQDYVLPDDFGYDINVLNVTDGIALSKTDVQTWSNNKQGDIDEQGSVSSYIIVEDNVRNQPASASTIVFVSSDTSDNQTVHVRGIDSTGRAISDDVVLDGTTNKTTTNTYLRVIGISKSGVSVGIVTGTAGSVTICYLAPTELVCRVKKIRLIDVPSGVSTIQVFYYSKGLPLYSDGDYPEIDCEECIEAGATADAWRFKRMFAKSADWEAKFEKELANLAWEKESQPNQGHQMNPTPYSRDIF